MQTQTQTNDAALKFEGDSQRSAPGRKNSAGDEKTIKVRPIKDGVADLMKLYNKAEAARTTYQDASKAVAEKGGIEVSTLKKLIKSSAKGNFAEVKADIEQQVIIFSEVGEIAGGPAAGD